MIVRFHRGPCLLIFCLLGSTFFTLWVIPISRQSLDSTGIRLQRLKLGGSVPHVWHKLLSPDLRIHMRKLALHVHGRTPPATAFSLNMPIVARGRELRSCHRAG